MTYIKHISIVAILLLATIQFVASAERDRPEHKSKPTQEEVLQFNSKEAKPAFSGTKIEASYPILIDLFEIDN